MKLESAANIATIGVCVMVAALILWRDSRQTLATGGRTKAPVRTYEPGELLDTIAGEKLVTGDRTFVLVVSRGRRYCRDSMPFYRQLASAAHVAESRLMVVGVCLGGERTGCEEFLAQEQLSVNQTLAATSGSLRVRGTPTLIALDRFARIVRVWSGQLSAAGEGEVMGMLSNRP